MRPVVIYDPDLDLAAIVDTEKFRAWGPAMVGSDGRRLLGEWLDTLPDDPEGLPAEAAAEWFVEYLSKTGQMPGEAPAQAPSLAAVPAEGQSGPEAAQALSEARDVAGAPPAPAPADTDPTASDGPTPGEQSASTSLEPSGAAESAGSGEAAPAEPSGGIAPGAASAQAPPTETTPCGTCNGTGQLTYEGEDGMVTQACAICSGTGRVAVAQ